MKTLCIFGRLPALSIAELESLYGADIITPVGEHGALLDIDPKKVDFSRLGGTVKFCKVLTVLDTVNWGEIEKFLRSTIPQHLSSLPEGKMKLGLSLYGFDLSPAKINASALSLKKLIKKAGRSVRVVPNDATALNSAKVLHNQLTGALGWELVFVKNGSETIAAQNIAEQDIDAYAKRDQARPKRDAKVGMLPPKLAQTIVNLAAPQAKSLLDPFCGTGVILQEALLMGLGVYGTDIDQRMVEYSQANLDWLKQQNFAVCGPEKEKKDSLVETGDATSFTWSRPFEAVATEAYLGRPFTHEPKTEDLKEAMQNTNLIIKKFLKNLASQTDESFRLCIAVPAWKIKGELVHLPLIDQLTDMGYNRLSFVHAKNEELVYQREGQIVARELLVLSRI